MLTLESAIQHCYEETNSQERMAKLHPKADARKGSGSKHHSYMECAREHRQLAAWLEELKMWREGRLINE